MQVEFLFVQVFGDLGNGSSAGLRRANLNSGPGGAGWYYASRESD